MAVVWNRWNSSHAKFGVVLLPKMGAGRAKHYQGCALAKHMLWGRTLRCLGAFGGCFPNLHRKIAVELNVEVESIFESNRRSCQAVGWSSRLRRLVSTPLTCSFTGVLGSLAVLGRSCFRLFQNDQQLNLFGTIITRITSIIDYNSEAHWNTH